MTKFHQVVGPQGGEIRKGGRVGGNLGKSVAKRRERGRRGEQKRKRNKRRKRKDFPEKSNESKSTGRGPHLPL